MQLSLPMFDELPHETAKDGSGDTSALNESMSSLAASPARTSASAASAPVYAKAHALVYGVSSGDSLAKFDPAQYCWKMSQTSFISEAHRLLLTLPRWGMTQNGALFLRRMQAHRTFGKDGGVSRWATPRARDSEGEGLQASFRRHTPMISSQVKWSTPQARDWKGANGVNRQSPDLPAEVMKWNMPTANDAKQTTLPMAVLNRDSLPGDLARMGLRQENMHLNPAWVETLMGYPQGWTELD